MMQITRAAVAVLLAAALAACTARTDPTVGRHIDDASITAAIKAKLAGDRLGALTGVDVDTVNGIVYLSGTVPDPVAKQRAAELAREVDGVARVENNLQARVAPGAGDAPRNRHATE